MYLPHAHLNICPLYRSCTYIFNFLCLFLVERDPRPHPQSLSCQALKCSPQFLALSVCISKVCVKCHWTLATQSLTTASPQQVECHLYAAGSSQSEVTGQNVHRPSSSWEPVLWERFVKLAVNIVNIRRTPCCGTSCFQQGPVLSVLSATSQPRGSHRHPCPAPLQPLPGLSWTRDTAAGTEQGWRGSPLPPRLSTTQHCSFQPGFGTALATPTPPPPTSWEGLGSPPPKLLWAAGRRPHSARRAPPTPHSSLPYSCALLLLLSVIRM